MGISQQIGSSSLSKPGVCTSSTRPATPYEGQMIYETDTDLSYIYGNSAWQQIAGSTAVGNSGLVYVTSATYTATNDLIISNCFSSTYTNYKIIFEVDTASTSVGINFQFRDGSGDLSGSYYSSGSQTNIGSATVTRYAESNTANSLALVAYTTLTYGFCHLEVMRPNETQYTMYNNTNMNYRPATDLIEQRIYAGAYQQTTAVTGIHFYTGSAATFAGKYFIYGYRKA